ncbi:MAG TPA: SUMF1/EgtB/PvdO family nonheme iron enzyme, partial [Nannocystis sp.]
ARADVLRRRAAELLTRVALHAPVAAKLPAWTLEDEVQALCRDTDLAEERAVQLLRAALTYAPDLELAHDLLADRFHRLHVQAEQQRDPLSAARHEILLREHGSSRYAEYLRGDGSLTLVTDPPGATAELHMFVREGRRLRPSLLRDLGATPVERLSLALGSYLVVVRAPGRATVHYPVLIERLHHWDSVRPGDTREVPIYLPRVDELGPDECYVPAGWFHSGGDPAARNSLPGRRLWLDGYVLRRFPVTIGEYLEFLNDLVATGRHGAAAQHAPPVPAWEEGRSAEGHEPGVFRGADGRYVLDGPAHTLRWPVAMVNWEAANVYAAWFAARTGLPWRLCAEMEHEKALRGVDARAFPWGEFLDPTFCCMRLSHQNSRALRAAVDEYPDDESVYEVRGLAGNVHTWCADAMQMSGPTIVAGIPQLSDGSDIRGVGAGGTHRVVRGGSWRSTEDACRGAFREGPPAVYRDTVLGLRLARPLP